MTHSSLHGATAPVMLAVLEYGELPEMLRVAESARAALDAPLIFFFVKHGYRRLAADTAEVVIRGFQWMDAAGTLHAQPAAGEQSSPQPVAKPQAAPPTPALPSGAQHRSDASRMQAMARIPFAAFSWLMQAWLTSARTAGREVANFLRDRSRFKRRYRELHAILLRHKPSLLIVGQDGPGSDLSFLLIAAGRLRIPRLITPFAMFSIEETAEYAMARPDCHAGSSALNRLVAKTYAHWVLLYKDRQLLRLPGYRALALESTGLIQGLPWTPLSEPVEAISADSKVAAKTLINLGVAQERLHVTGSPVQDRLSANLENGAALKQRLCAELQMDPAKPLILCGWPVNMFSWLAGRTIDYPNYEAVATAWTRILCMMRDRHGVNVIVSVHPKTLAHEYMAAEQAGLPCKRGGVEELIAACDLFTTLNGSSITSWAIACAKPVLLFDCFQTGYRDFLDVPGCVTVQSEEAFAAELDALCAHPQRRAALADKQRSASSHWGELDGQAGPRLGALLRQVAMGSIQ